MSPLLSDQSRLLALIIGATILWCVESLRPLYGSDKHRLRRALPNIALTALLVVTNLALSVVTASVANFANNERLGLFFMFALPFWLTTLFGIMALDLFTYREEEVRKVPPLSGKFRVLRAILQPMAVKHARILSVPGSPPRNMSDIGHVENSAVLTG